MNTPDNIHEVVDQYKRYIETSVLNRGFDFTTWYQHQFGATPDGVLVEPKLDFCVTEENTAHK